MTSYLRTFGARASQYVSEVVRAMATRGGAALVDDPALGRREGLTADYLAVVRPAWTSRGDRFAAVLRADADILRTEPRDRHPSSAAAS